MIPLTGTSRLPRRIFPCVHMEYFVPLAEMKLHCSSIISVCKTSTFQSSNTAYCKHWTGLGLDWTLDWTLDWILDWTLDLNVSFYSKFSHKSP